MRDLARRLGLSPSTVSRALANDPRISVATRKAVGAAAKRMGYRVNPFFSHALRSARKRLSQESPVLVFLNFLERPEQFTENGYYRHIWDGLRHEAARLDFRVEMIQRGPAAPGDARLLKQLHARGIQGLVLGAVLMEHLEGFPPFPCDNFCAIAVSASYPDPAVHRVVPDLAEAVDRGLRFLSAQGVQRPGFIVGESTLLTTRAETRKCFRGRVPDWFADRKPKVLAIPERAVDETRCHRWIRESGIDGLLIHASPAVATVAAHGQLPGRPLPCVSISVSGAPPQGVTVIDQQPSEIGRVAIGTLVSLIHRHELGRPAHPRRICISPAEAV